MSLFDLTGKVAVITGSSRGIGKAIAEQLAARGAKVVVSSRKQDACDEVAASINSAHGSGTALAVAASISSSFAKGRMRCPGTSPVGRSDRCVTVPLTST